MIANELSNVVEMWRSDLNQTGTVTPGRLRGGIAIFDALIAAIDTMEREIHRDRLARATDKTSDPNVVDLVQIRAEREIDDYVRHCGHMPAPRDPNGGAA